MKLITVIATFALCSVMGATTALAINPQPIPPRGQIHTAYVQSAGMAAPARGKEDRIDPPSYGFPPTFADLFMSLVHSFTDPWAH